jgi:hypothetical protein
MSINLKPDNLTVYPPFKNGKYMEEYFDEYWQKQTFPEKSQFVYLDIYWLNMFMKSSGNVNNIIQNISNHVINICNNAANENKIVFTVCQWDDGICMGHLKPNNLIVFSIGQSVDVPLPLIAEDKNNTLCNLPKSQLSERTILASFIGTSTHHLRERMSNALSGKEGFEIIIKNGWDINVADNLVKKFINTTQRSRFGLAPRGYGPSSFRFFEIMEMGIVPVYIHDGDNALPYKDILDYSRFSISIHINDIDRLPDILRSISDEQYMEMVAEIKRVLIWFTPEGLCNYIKQWLIDKKNNNVCN